MSSLLEFSPLEALSLPGIGLMDCSGLTLIVGPNSAGKSQLLRDIHQRMSGEPRQLVVASDVKAKRLPYEPLMKALADAGFIYRYEDDAGTPHIRPMTTYVGTGQAAGQMQANQLQSWHSTHNAAQEGKRRKKDEYLGYFGRFLVTALFLDHRLTALNQAGMIDFVNSPPQHDLHALHMNDSARTQLFEEIRASFAKGVWPDISRGTGVCLRVSDQGDIPTAEDRLSPIKMNGYRTIETEGDGLKSYVATCVALLLGRRPLCLVDEPEMCLHPPQAYNLGRFIGRFGASSDAITLVATHSSHILRGVLQTSPKVRIVRLTRLGSRFKAHLVAPETLEQAMAKPTVRGESVLDGIFAQAVVVLEADGDRTVYQAAWESLTRASRLDIHFAAVGGTGGLADTCHLYGALHIPVVVIADLDVIAESDRLRRTLDALECPRTDELIATAQKVIQKLKELPPALSVGDVKAQIEQALPRGADWEGEEDASLKTRLNQIARRLDRMRRLKVTAAEPLPDHIQHPLTELIADLHSYGMFVVPVGELEEWLSAERLTASKQNKWAWANEAAAVLRSKAAQEGDIWEFVRKVGDHLDAQYSTYAA